MKHSLAQAYSFKKNAKKFAEGGETSTTGNKTKTGGSNPGGASTGGAGTVTITTGKNPPQSINISDIGGRTAARNAGGMDPGDEDDDMMAKGGVMKSKRDRAIEAFKGPMMAEGGQITDNYQTAGLGTTNPDLGDNEQKSGYIDHMGNVVQIVRKATDEDMRTLGQHGAKEQGPEGVNMSEGGQITDNEQSEDHDLDMVGRIMKQRQDHFSEGGKVANDVSDLADFKENEFDDLVLRDDLKSTYGEDNNSGDATGDAQEDEDRRDIISRIMKQRKMKQTNPRPA